MDTCDPEKYLDDIEMIASLRLIRSLLSEIKPEYQPIGLTKMIESIEKSIDQQREAMKKMAYRCIKPKSQR